MLEPQLPKITLAGVTVYDARSWFPDLSPWYARTKEQITGVALHPDAAAYDGTTIDDERQRMQTIYDFHTGPTWDWPGIGYNLDCFPSGRIYLVGDMLTVRAHVAHRNTPLAGIVGAGDFTEHPPSVGHILTYGSALVWTWAYTGRILPAEGHRFWAVEGWATACPGDTWQNWVPVVKNAAVAIANHHANQDAALKIRAALAEAWNKGDWQMLNNQLDWIGFRP